MLTGSINILDQGHFKIFNKSHNVFIISRGSFDHRDNELPPPLTMNVVFVAISPIFVG